MDKQTIDDIQQIAASEHGRSALRYICHELCGWTSPNITLTTTHDVSLQVMLSRESQRSLWVELRKFIPRKDLIEIELYEPPQPAEKAKEETPVTEDGLQCQTMRQEIQQQTQEAVQEQGLGQQEMLHRQRRQRPTTEPS